MVVTTETAPDGLDPRSCGARKRDGSGDTCRLAAGWGVPGVTIGRCRLHGGKTRTQRQATAGTMARQDCARLGVPIETGPSEALLAELCETVGNVAFYRDLIQQLEPHPDPDEYIQGEDGEDGHWVRGEPGVYGRTYHVSGLPTGEGKAHILVTLYNAERKHLKEVSAAALSAGCQERAVAAMTDLASTVVAVLSDFAARMGIDQTSEAAREAGREALSLIAGGQTATG